MLRRGNELFGEPVREFVMPDVFLIAPFEPLLHNIYEENIKPVCNRMKLSVKRGDEFARTGSVMRQVWSAICGAKFIIADLTQSNPNVFYEIGIAHALGKETILICQSEDDIPFNIQYLRTIIYDRSEQGLKKFRSDLYSMLEGKTT